MPDICTNPLLKGKNKKVYMIDQYRFSTDAILVTMTPTAGFTVGFQFTFTGNVYIDFKDGGGKEALTSGVEKTHLYSSAGTYIAEITGDLENITVFIADNCRITSIANLKTGLLTGFNISSNLYSGTLDMTNARIKNQFIVNSNTGLINIIFATSGNELVTLFRVFSTSLVTLNLTNVPISGSVEAEIRNISTLTTLIFSSSGNGVIGNMKLYLNDLSYFDMTVFTQWITNNNVRFQGNSMTAAEVNHILVDLYSIVASEPPGGSYTGRFVEAHLSNAAPDGSSGGYDGLTAKTGLISKGISVTTN